MGLFDDVLDEQPKKKGLFDDVLEPPARSLGDTAGGLTLDLLSGTMRAAKSVPDLALMGRAAARKIPVVGDIVGSRAVDAPLQVVSNFFGRGITAADELEPESYGERRSAPIIRRDEAGDFAGFNMPTPEAIVGTVTESLPQIPQLLAGGGLGSAALRGLGASPRIAQALGLGASNAALVSPQQYADTLEEAGIAEAATEAERQAAERKALTAAGLTGVLSTGTGAAGAALAAPLGTASRSLPAALAKGFVADAPFEGIEEGGQSLIGDYALGRELDFLGAADAATLGALAGGVPGAAIAGTQYVGDRAAGPSGLFDDVLMPSEDQMADTLGGRIVPQPLGEAASQDIPVEDTADLDRLLNAISPEVLERALGELVQDADAPFRRPEPVQPVAAGGVGAPVAVPAGQPNAPVTPLVEESTQPVASSQEIPDVQEQPQERSGETLRSPQPRRSGEPAALPGGDSGVRAAAEAIAGSPATEGAGEPGGTREPARDAGEAAGGNRLPATEPEVRADQPRPADVGTEGGGRVEVGQKVRAEVGEGQEVRQEVDDRPSPPTLVQYGKRRQASATSTPEQRARAEARVNRLFRDELDPNNPDIEVRMENGRTFPESAYTRKLIADSMKAEQPAETLLKGIAEHPGVSEDQRWLANRLAPLMTSLEVQLVEPPANLPYAGAYNNTNNTMWIRQAAPSTVIHEALHGVTSALLTSKVARDTNPTIRNAYNEFNDLLGTLQGHIASIDTSTLPEAVQEVIDNKQGPLSNIKELLTYGMTDKDFQDFLRTVPAPEGRAQARNLWQSFKNAIISLFGELTNSQRNYLDALIESTADLVEFAGANPKATRMIQKSEASRLGAPMDPQTVYHGTPHTVEKFSLQKIGTGEGTQTYGWGLYFAGKKEVADHYRGAIGKATEKTNELRPAAQKAIKDNDYLGFDTLGEALTAIRQHSDFAERWDIPNPDDVKSLRDYRNSFGNLYQVDVPEDTDLLDYDKPLSEQSEKVMDSLESLGFSTSADSDVSAMNNRLDILNRTIDRGGSDADKAMQEKSAILDSLADKDPDGLDIYRRLSDSLGSERAASEALLSAGIPGLRYLDGSSRNKGEGSYNYVIWDEGAVSDPRIDAAGIRSPQTQTAAFKKWFGDSKVVDADGNPMVVYHGTNAKFDAFKESDQGIHFGTEPQANMRNGKVAVPVYLSASKIKRVKDTPGGWAKSVKAAKAAGNDGIVYLNRFEGVPLERFEALRARGITDAKMDAMPDSAFRKLVPEASDSYIVFKPEQIKSATGNVGTFDPSDPSIDAAGIRRSRQDAEKDAEVRRQEAAGTLPVSRGTPGWNYDDSVWEGPKGAAKRARMRLQDKMTGWADVQNQIAEQIGQAIPDAQNVYQAENLMHGRVSESIDRLERNHIKPLVEAMRKADVSVPKLEEYLYARHAKERNERIAKINPKMPDGGSGMTTADAEAILKAADRAKLEPLAKRVDAMTKANRRRLVEHGLITQEEFDAMDAAYKFYAPLRGKGERGPTDFDAASGGAGRGLDTRRAPTKKALGRGAGNLAENILGEVIGDAQRGIILAEKARVGRTLMRLVLANPNPDLWTVEPVQTERKTDSEGMVYEAVINDWSDPSIVAVRHNGKLYRVQIENQPLAQALNSVGVDQMHTVFRALGGLNRYFSAVLTKYNPAFTGVNAARDALFGLTGMAVEHGELAAARAALSYAPAAKAAFRQAAGLFNPNNEWDVWAKEFAESGGKTGYVNMPSVEDIQRKIGKGSLLSYSPTGLSRAAKAVADAVGIANDAVENALRLSAYVTLRKSGMSEAKAASYAKDLTVNFNRKGLDGSTLNSLFLFYNASIQGAKRVGDLMRKPKTWGYLSALAGAQAIATLAMLGMEDDDGMNMWDKIPPHVKARNMVIPVNAEHFITVPMPYGFNLFVWLSGRMTDAFAQPNKKGNKASDIAADTISNAVQSFSPVPLDDGAMGLVPTAVRIPLNVQANRDDFGYQIRQDNPYGKYDVPRASMGKADTLELFKITAKAMNRIGGGDDYTPPPMSFFDVAPEDLEYLLEELTGGTGKFLLDTTAAAAGLADPSRDMKPRDIPLTKRFFSNVDDVATQRSMFYDRRDSIERKLEQLRDIAKNDGIEQAEQFLKATLELRGAMFRLRKKVTGLKLPGTIIGADTGDVQIVEDKNLHDSVFALYKAADKATKARGQAVKAAYAKVPPELLPNARTRARDAEIREADREAAEVQRKLNTVWTREVVGAADPTPTQP